MVVWWKDRVIVYWGVLLDEVDVVVFFYVVFFDWVGCVDSYEFVDCFCVDDW